MPMWLPREVVAVVASLGRSEAAVVFRYSVAVDDGVAGRAAGWGNPGPPAVAWKRGTLAPLRGRLLARERLLQASKQESQHMGAKTAQHVLPACSFFSFGTDP